MAGSVLAFIGVAVMIFLSGTGSAIGTAIGGAATIGGLKKREEKFGNYMVLAALPATQGLYGFLGFFLLQGTLKSGNITDYQGAAIFGAGLALGVTALFSALHQAKVCAHAIKAVADGQDGSFGKGMVLAVFPELYSIIALLVVIFINGFFTA